MKRTIFAKFLYCRASFELCIWFWAIAWDKKMSNQSLKITFFQSNFFALFVKMINICEKINQLIYLIYSRSHKLEALLQKLCQIFQKYRISTVLITKRDFLKSFFKFYSYFLNSSQSTTFNFHILPKFK